MESGMDRTVRVEEELQYPKTDFDSNLDWINPYGIDQDEFMGSFAKQPDSLSVIPVRMEGTVFGSLDSRSSTCNILSDSQSDQSSQRSGSRVKWVVLMVCLIVVLLGSLAGLTFWLLLDQSDSSGRDAVQDDNVTVTTSPPTHSNNTQIVQTNCSESDFTSPHQVRQLAGGLTVLVDVKADSRDWVIFQRRTGAKTVGDGPVQFNRHFDEYSTGFGDFVKEPGQELDDFWLGLDTIHQLCNETALCEMRVELRVQNQLLCSDWHAQYAHFGVTSRRDNYTLTLANFSGNAGDAMTSQWQNKSCDLNGSPFGFVVDGSKFYAGGWWVTDSQYVCSNLNGLWGRNANWFDGVRWVPITDRLAEPQAFPPDIVLTEMKLRPYSDT